MDVVTEGVYFLYDDDELVYIGESDNLFICWHPVYRNPYPIKEQVAKIGNSVVPIMAMKIAKANLESK